MMFEDITYRQLTSLSPLRRLRSIVYVISHEKKTHQIMRCSNKV